MQLSCSCLNVNITVVDYSDDPEALKQFLRAELTSVIDSTVEWFVGHVSSEKSIRIVWQTLNETIPIRLLSINRCLVCQQYTHITNNESNRILINKNLLDESSVRTRLKEKNYSSIATIVLPNNSNSFDLMCLPVDQDETCRREQDLIQQMYRQAVENLEQETEERIRLFQREQEEILQKKTDGLNKELETLTDLIRSTSRHGNLAKLSPPMRSSSSYIHENSMESGFGSDIFDSNAHDWSRQSSTAERSQSERNSNPEDDSTVTTFDLSTNPSLYGTSLPKEIPFRPMLIAQKDDDQNDLERIGKSFRQLSQSLMCTDGTELFGDLPSPRLNFRAT